MEMCISFGRFEGYEAVDQNLRLSSLKNHIDMTKIGSKTNSLSLPGLVLSVILGFVMQCTDHVKCEKSVIAAL